MDGQMRITVLGSSGQIGAYLSEYLSRKGHIVREFDVVNLSLIHISEPTRPY